MQIINKRLLVVLSPDKFDRNTESHFSDLFTKVDYIWPPHLHSFPNDPPNPIPTKDDVLLFEGGTDINPGLYGEGMGRCTQKSDTLRDSHEKSMFLLGQSVGAGMIGVCRGAQLLCALSGGHIIQDVTGHHTEHKMVIPDLKRVIPITSVHHQMMNPYILPENDWISLGFSPFSLSSRYLNGLNHKMKMWKIYSNWKEQEIVFFKKTKCLAIQGHPEYYVWQDSAFPAYCRELIKKYLLKPSSGEQTIC